MIVGLDYEHSLIKTHINCALKNHYCNSSGSNNNNSNDDDAVIGC